MKQTRSIGCRMSYAGWFSTDVIVYFLESTLFNCPRVRDGFSTRLHTERAVNISIGPHLSIDGTNRYGKEIRVNILKLRDVVWHFTAPVLFHRFEDLC